MHRVCAQDGASREPSDRRAIHADYLGIAATPAHPTTGDDHDPRSRADVRDPAPGTRGQPACHRGRPSAEHGSSLTPTVDGRGDRGSTSLSPSDRRGVGNWWALVHGRLERRPRSRSAARRHDGPSPRSCTAATPPTAAGADEIHRDEAGLLRTAASAFVTHRGARDVRPDEPPLEPRRHGRSPDRHALVSDPLRGHYDPWRDATSTGRTGHRDATRPSASAWMSATIGRRFGGSTARGDAFERRTAASRVRCSR